MPDNNDGLSVCLYCTNKQSDRLTYGHTDMLKEIKKDRHTYQQTGTQTHK